MKSLAYIEIRHCAAPGEQPEALDNPHSSLPLPSSGPALGKIQKFYRRDDEKD